MVPAGRWLLTQQAAFQSGMAQSLRGVHGGEGAAFWGLMGLCLAYGFVHAAGPGHGKALLAAYGTARRVPLLKLAGIGFLSAMAQGTAAVFLVLVLAVPTACILGLLAMQPLRRYSEARHVAYGLTDRRAVMLVGGENSRIADAAPSRFVEGPSIRDHGNGTATVLFIRPPRAGGRYPGAAETAGELTGFVAVSHAGRLVEELARQRAARDRAKGDHAVG